MDRPLLLVPGYRGLASHGRALAQALGQSDFTAVFHAGQEDAFRATVRAHPVGTAYAIEFSDRQDSFIDQTVELTTALAILQEETGLETDVVAHSMGGLVVREHLDRGKDGIADLIMLGVPNHGVALARGADFFRLGWLLGEGPHDFRDDSDHLNALNSRWADQRARLDQVVSVAGTRLPVPIAEPPFVEGGDGAVSYRSVALPDVDVHTVEELDPDSGVLEDNHSALLRNPKVLALIRETITSAA